MNDLKPTAADFLLKSLAFLLVAVVSMGKELPVAMAGPLWAGAAKVDITDREAGPVNDPLFAKALVLKSEDTIVALVTVDAVAIGEIGYIKNDYLGKVRGQIERELHIEAEHVFINASHCHGVVRADVDERTFEAVKLAMQKLVPVNVGAGTGREDRISENRRLKLKDGTEVDVRHAYSLPADEDVAEVGPIDPEIGLLRFDDQTGQTVAVLFNFACHPIQGVPSGANSADITGFASQVIEDNLGKDTIALFFQGCAGDINPVHYKDVDHPRDAEILGNMLGLSALKGIRKITPKADVRFVCRNEVIALPRADYAERIANLEARQLQLARSLKGTSLNLKTFLPLSVKYSLSEEFPSYYSHRYLQERELGRQDLEKLDAENRRNLKQYITNIQTMEEITRVNTNLALLKKHHASLIALGKRTVDVELGALRIGDVRLVTFPGELTVRIGLNIKKASPHEMTFVAGYTNGYIYYAPTAEQLQNAGAAQEDCDSILAPEWQDIYEAKVMEMLKEL